MQTAAVARPYPQMPPLTDDECVSLLETIPVARLATHNPDGSIHVVPVVFEYVDGAILIGTQEITRKVGNIRRDPRVTVLVDDPAMPPKGVMIYGTASLDTEDLVPERIEILARSMPREQAEGMVAVLAARYEPAVIRITPTKMVSWDYAKPSPVLG